LPEAIVVALIAATQPHQRDGPSPEPRHGEDERRCITQVFYQHAVPCLEEDAIARFAALVDGSKTA